MTPAQPAPASPQDRRKPPDQESPIDSIMKQLFGRSRLSCPGRDAAFFTLLRRTGTPVELKKAGPRLCSAPLRKSYALRCVRGTRTPYNSRAMPGSAGTKRTSTNSLRSMPAPVLAIRTRVWTP